MIILILSIIFFLFALIIFYKANNIKILRTDENNKIQQQITILQKDYQKYENDIIKEKEKLKQLLEQKFNISQTIKNQQIKLQEWYNNHKVEATNKLNKELEENRNQINKAYESYCDTIDWACSIKEKKVIQIQKQREQVEKQLAQIKSVYQAATAARIREKEEQDKRKFYQLQISDKQIADIITLKDWKRNLNDPSIVSKIIWSSYVIKPASDLCNRVVGSTAVCGIYKITNMLSGDVYIGQSVNISDRFKQHIKCGLGIDASSTNKLYNNMQEYGVWNFTFEILQRCSRDKLNEKERFWIEMYQSNKIGMNITKGNK